MKQLLLTGSLATLALTGCVSSDLYEGETSVDVHNLINLSSYSVPVKEGHTTYVCYQGDTLAIAQESTTINVPQTAIQTKAQALEVSFVEGTDPKAGTWQMWQTVAFEDSRKGDYDYNDLVIHVKYVYNASTGRHTIGVHPIALGSTKNIALGYKIFNGQNEVCDRQVCSNCREELFEGIEGFINTSSFTNHYTTFAKKLYDTVEGRPAASNISVVWYVVVDNNVRLYAVNDRYSFLDENSRPYGLIITDTGKTYWQEDQHQMLGANWFSYPKEGYDISSCYPAFDAWLQGGTFSPEGNQNTFDIDDSTDGDNRRLYVVPAKNAGL